MILILTPDRPLDSEEAIEFDSIMNWSSPIPENDVVEICSLIRSHGVLVAPNPAIREDTYNVATYLFAKRLHGVETRALLDRNITTRLVQLAGGKIPDRSSRLAAATFTFLQMIDAAVEPAVSLFELADLQGNEKPNDELSILSQIDNTHPQILADVALHGTPINPDQLHPPLSSLSVVDFSKRNHYWRTEYISALKVGTLLRSHTPPEVTLANMIEWMGRDFLFDSVALQLLLIYLAPKKDPLPCPVKSLMSKNREKRLKGVRNLAWDMTVIRDWSSRALHERHHNIAWLLASMDSFLIKVANSVFTAASSDQDADIVLKQRLADAWGSEIGVDLYNQYDRARTQPEERRFLRCKTAKDSEELIRELEAELVT